MHSVRVSGQLVRRTNTNLYFNPNQKPRTASPRKIAPDDNVHGMTVGLGGSLRAWFRAQTSTAIRRPFFKKVFAPRADQSSYFGLYALDDRLG